MTDQTPESTDPRSADEAIPQVDAEFIEPDGDPVDEAEAVDAEVVDAEVVDPVSLDLGSAEAVAPTGTDFDVVSEPHPDDAAPAGDIVLGDAATAPPLAEPAAPASTPEPTSAQPTSAQPTSAQPNSAQPTAAGPSVPPSAPPATPYAPPSGGSFLDLPPLPDLTYPAPTPPPASPYPPPAASYPQAANYPPATNSPRADYAPYPADYSEQAASQAYGHGAPAPTPVPAPQPAPMSPYGTPTGFAVQPYQTASGDTAMASLAHWGALVANVFSGTALGFLVPLVLMLTKGQTDPLVRANAVESLNFNLTVIIGMIASVILLIAFIGIAGLIAIPIVAIILQILGAMAASRGEVYRYPISIRFLK